MKQIHLSFISFLLMIGTTCIAQTEISIDEKVKNEVECLRTKLNLDEFQSTQIRKIRTEYYNRIFSAFKEYNNKGNKGRLLLDIAMVTVNNDHRIYDQLNKKQKKIFIDKIQRKWSVYCL